MSFNEFEKNQFPKTEKISEKLRFYLKKLIEELSVVRREPGLKDLEELGEMGEQVRIIKDRIEEIKDELMYIDEIEYAIAAEAELKLLQEQLDFGMEEFADDFDTGEYSELTVKDVDSVKTELEKRAESLKKIFQQPHAENPERAQADEEWAIITELLEAEKTGKLNDLIKEILDEF